MSADSGKLIRQADCTEKYAAITIDDGPYPGSTEKLLKVLAKHNIKATFFILGENAAEYPELLASIREQGHEIASHSFTHRHLNKMSASECSQEFERADRLLGHVKLFRPPGGLYDEKVLCEAEKYNYQVVLWSIDTLDWQKPTSWQVVQRVMANIEPGSIILMHDGQANLPTAAAIDVLANKLKPQGYSFKTVSELISGNK